MAVENVDLLTIGAGGGGYPAAFKLAQAGRTAVMVDEKGIMSGNCLYEGCVPSKAVREVADIINSQQRLAGKGFLGSMESDIGAIMKHKDDVQAMRYNQHLAEMNATPGLRLIKGIARFTGPHDVEIQTDDKGILRFHCRNIIIASGCDIFVPPIPGSELLLTSHNLYKPNADLKTKPSRMVVVGGGYIGLETASFFAAFGTEVTVVNRSERLLKSFDASLVERLLPLLSPRIKMQTGVAVLGVERSGSGFVVHTRVNGESQDLECDVVVAATGRRPRIPQGTAELGIELDAKKGVVVGPSLQTSAYKHIYACGDVNGHNPLFHAAVRQSLVAAANMLMGDRPVDYADFNHVPNTVFTIPAAACVGMTPSEAKTKGVEFITSHYDFSEDSHAQILDQLEGGIDLYFEPGTLRLLGGEVLGVDAGLLIGQIGTAAANGVTAYELAKFADQHPLSSEGISKAARRLV